MIACIAPPGAVFGHTATVEKSPWSRANADALLLCALFNSFPFDWLVRQKAATHLSLSLLNALPLPDFSEVARQFLAHGALRLSCNGPSYHALWQEQVQNEQRRPVPRMELRAQVDAVVAQAYGLDRAGYKQILGSFSHRSCARAAELCLSAMDVLQAGGINGFCRA